MEETLSPDNILSSVEIDNLFVDDNLDKEQQSDSEQTLDSNIPSDKTSEGNEDTEEDIQETTEVDVDDLFTEPESVGSEKSEDDSGNKEDTPSDNKESASPIYSSIAKALVDEGVLPNLDDVNFDDIKSSTDFIKVIDESIKNQLDERQKRIDEALNYGVQPNEIQKHEQIISTLSSIDPEAIKAESDQGEKLRKQLIFQDYLNRGYSEERAEREVSKSFQAGTDIEDASEALKSTIDFYKGNYEKIINEAKEREEKAIKERDKQAEEFKKSIMDDKNFFGELSVDKSTRRKIYDTISKPVYKNPDNGQYYTELQRYQQDNPIEFLKNIGLVYTLTNGFKDMNGLIKTKVKKEMSKGLRELEHTLNNTARTSDGNLKFVGNVEDDPDSIIGKGWNLDV